jgi:hypothetical protein
MILSIPQIEESFVHDSGDIFGVAGWLFDCLDQRPPSAGGSLTLYISYSETDRSLFLSANRDKNLISGLFTIYDSEVKWDGFGFGDLEFDIYIAHQPTDFLLRLREGVNKQGANSFQSTSVEICWREDNVAPGILSLVRRFNVPLPLETPIDAILWIVNGAEIAPHVDRWQQGIRWHERAIYLPEGQTALSAGAFPGCDLNVPAILSPLLITYDSEEGKWSWKVLGADWLPAGSHCGPLKLDFPGFDGEIALSLRGEVLSSPRSMLQQEAMNRLPIYFLEIVGCVLPLPRPQGYGILPEDLPASISSRVETGLRLPEGGWLYLDENTSAVCLICNGENPPGRVLRNRQRTQLSPTRSCVWIDSDKPLPPGFRGELIFDPPIGAVLSSGAVSGDIPHDLFPRYVDVTLGRAPVRLESPDGRKYFLAFHSAAQHSVFVFDSHSKEINQFRPETVGSVELESIADFVIGGTHYRLQPSSNANEANLTK